jgi:chromosome segregation ATPase
MESKYEVETLNAYKILEGLLTDHTIDQQTFSKYKLKLDSLNKYLMKYIEMETVLAGHLNDMKEKNNKTLNEFTILQSQQNDLNDKLYSLSEECRKAKTELSEYENTRILQKQYNVERLQEHIKDLNDKIDMTEKQQVEDLRKDIKKIEEEIAKKVEEFEALENDINNKENQSREIQNLREKVEINNKHSKYKIIFRKEGKERPR